MTEILKGNKQKTFSNPLRGIKKNNYSKNAILSYSVYNRNLDYLLLLLFNECTNCIISKHGMIFREQGKLNWKNRLKFELIVCLKNNNFH